MQGKFWCFTINNPTAADVTTLSSLVESGEASYLVFGRETAPTTGTPHLQGYVAFVSNQRRAAATTKLGGRASVRLKRGTHKQASDYCKKDGDFEEYGELPTEQQGKRSDWDRYKEWVVELGRIPTRDELINHNTSLYARYSKRCYEIAAAYLPSPQLVAPNQQPRFGWQLRVEGLITAENASDRSIHFVVDPEGNSGKSWMCRWALSKHPNKVQVMRIGKRDDLAYSVDETKSVFLFDVPRNQMTYLQYSVLESLKDQVIFSPKYESSCKILRTKPQVIIFSNEHPDMNALTNDRYNIIEV